MCEMRVSHVQCMRVESPANTGESSYLTVQWIQFEGSLKHVTHGQRLGSPIDRKKQCKLKILVPFLQGKTPRLPPSVKWSKDDEKVKWHAFLSPLGKTVSTFCLSAYTHFADVNLWKFLLSHQFAILISPSWTSSPSSPSLSSPSSPITLPNVNFNEPLSMLQRMVGDFIYSDILTKPASCDTSLEELMYMAAFTTLCYAPIPLSFLSSPLSPFFSSFYPFPFSLTYQNCSLCCSYTYMVTTQWGEGDPRASCHRSIPNTIITWALSTDNCIDIITHKKTYAHVLFLRTPDLVQSYSVSLSLPLSLFPSLSLPLSLLPGKRHSEWLPWRSSILDERILGRKNDVQRFWKERGRMLSQKHQTCCGGRNLHSKPGRWLLPASFLSLPTPSLLLLPLQARMWTNVWLHRVCVLS